jgi:hypothetical protein
VGQLCRQLNSDDKPVPPERGERESERGFASKEASGLPSSQTATTMAADVHATLPMELRFLALGLPMPEIWRGRHEIEGENIGADSAFAENDKGVAIFDYALDNRPSTGRGNGRPAVSPTR